jgi:deazaflavin-dependent oxidoreductase (nitroreductase family)
LEADQLIDRAEEDPMPAEMRTPKVPGFVPLFNPIARRLLGGGVPLGPNALLTVRGRRSGLLRTTPVALVEIGGRRWVIGTFGNTNWVRNLRDAGAATVSVGKHEDRVTARELTQPEAAAFLSGTLLPYVGRIRIGKLLLRMLGARDIVEDPAGAAANHPVFELEAEAKAA